MLPPELLHILACPICNGDLVSIEAGAFLSCRSCNRDYPVVDGIPVLLPEQIHAPLGINGEAP